MARVDNDVVEVPDDEAAGLMPLSPTDRVDDPLLELIDGWRELAVVRAVSQQYRSS